MIIETIITTPAKLVEVSNFPPVTNLSLGNTTSNSLEILSSTGSSVVIPSATTSLAGLLSSTDKTKLNNFSFSFNNTNGFTGVVSNPTTTPSLSLTLQNATSLQSGQLTSSDWNLFNNKLDKANKLRVINTVSDFPVQDATTITLESGYCYLISDVITTSKRFTVEQGVCLRSVTPFITMLTYTGTGIMFTSNNSSWLLTEITVSCPNARVIEYSGEGISIFDTVAVEECLHLGDFYGTGFTNLNWVNCTFYNVKNTGGLRFFGNINVFSYNKIYHISTGSDHVAIDLGTALFQTLEIRDVEGFGIAGSIGIKGLPDSGNLPFGALATVESSGFSGNAMTPLSGIAITDRRWGFIGNSFIEDTIEDALLHFNGNTTNTVIANPSTDGTNAVKVNAVWGFDRVSKYSATSDGRITYVGERKVTTPIDVSLHLISVGGGNITAKAYIVHSTLGLLTSTGTTCDLSGSTSKNLQIPWQITLNTGDWLEVWVENNTNGNDILAKQGIFRIR